MLQKIIHKVVLKTKNSSEGFVYILNQWLTK